MNFIEIPKTDRESWLQWRHDGIGSSDAPAIMGVSRFKTYDELLLEKSLVDALPEKKDNGYIKDRGNRIEQVVRKLYEEKMGMEFLPISCQNIKNPFLLATLDGIDHGWNLMIEIKLMSTQTQGKMNKGTPGYQKWAAAKEQGIVPVDYYPQIQHQLLTTGVPACMFIGLKEIKGKPITEDDLAIVSVLPDELYLKELLSKEQDFWKKVLTKRKKNSTLLKKEKT